jgi:cob(I)alamin adenosyltransferase
MYAYTLPLVQNQFSQVHFGGMGHRLSKIYTRTGDQGTTGLASGERVAKSHHIIEAGGAVDELNCQLGVLLSLELPAQIAQDLRHVQNQLFEIGGQISLPDYQAIQPSEIKKLEIQLDCLNAKLPPLKEFILPGGNPAGATCHLARAICRRAERRLCPLLAQDKNLQHCLTYLNRLSDYLFVCARILNHLTKNEEVYWQKGMESDQP